MAVITYYLVVADMQKDEPKIEKLLKKLIELYNNSTLIYQA